MSEQAQTTSKRKLKFWHIAAILALALIVAFGVLGVSREAALALSVQFAAIGYLSALPGAAVWLIEANRRVFQRSPKSSLPQKNE